MTSDELLAHIVLIEPEIPWNTGNAGRSCLAFGARLHLVEPLGFSLDAKAVRRAGLDYWSDVDLQPWPSWDALVRGLPGAENPWFITPDAGQTPWQVQLGPRPVLVFGRESVGLPESLRKRPERNLAIPMPGALTRSLNVSTTVGILLYEVARQTGRGPA